MLVIECSLNSGFTVAEATTILLSNSRGSTSTLAGQNHVFQWGFLRVLWVAGAVVRVSFPGQQET